MFSVFNPTMKYATPQINEENIKFVDSIMTWLKAQNQNKANYLTMCFLGNCSYQLIIYKGDSEAGSCFIQTRKWVAIYWYSGTLELIPIHHICDIMNPLLLMLQSTLMHYSILFYSYHLLKRYYLQRISNLSTITWRKAAFCYVWFWSKMKYCPFFFWRIQIGKNIWFNNQKAIIICLDCTAFWCWFHIIKPCILNIHIW